ncbi:hypothetical protein J6590_090195 [Homalodisca vitripennis]|nr:hypothetical protein J6590_090195 [Homalodisca vitripennis]
MVATNITASYFCTLPTRSSKFLTHAPKLLSPEGPDHFVIIPRLARRACLFERATEADCRGNTALVVW